jgi:hypothetical protein
MGEKEFGGGGEVAKGEKSADGRVFIILFPGEGKGKGERFTKEE